MASIITVNGMLILFSALLTVSLSGPFKFSNYFPFGSAAVGCFELDVLDLRQLCSRLGTPLIHVAISACSTWNVTIDDESFHENTADPEFNQRPFNFFSSSIVSVRPRKLLVKLSRSLRFFLSL